MDARKLTDKEVAALDIEHRTLAEKVDKQCKEQVEFLIKHISDDHVIDADLTLRLVGALQSGGFSVGLFRITDTNVSGVLNVQVVYSIDDELAAYLTKPAVQLPVALRGFLAGGTKLDLEMGKPTAEDKMPQTGKTKTY